MKCIIENGKYNVVKCQVCGCKYSFDVLDIEPDTKKVICPQCGAENTPTLKA